MPKKSKLKITPEPASSMHVLNKVIRLNYLSRELSKLQEEIADKFDELLELVSVADSEDHVLFPGDFMKLQNNTSDYFVVTIRKINKPKQ